LKIEITYKNAIKDHHMLHFPGLLKKYVPHNPSENLRNRLKTFLDISNVHWRFFWRTQYNTSELRNAIQLKEIGFLVLVDVIPQWARRWN